MKAFMTTFFAWMHRMRYIHRWALMRNTKLENLQEHSHDVAVLAHALALIRREYFSEPGRKDPDPNACAVYALFHDGAEIITGDLPMPVKYYSKELHRAYGLVEERAVEKLCQTLPEELKPWYREYLLPKNDSKEKEDLLRIVKMADTLSAYIKCVDEGSAHNEEFLTAAKTNLEKLQAYHDPALDWFLAHALPAYRLNLDELDREGPTLL